MPLLKILGLFINRFNSINEIKYFITNIILLIKQKLNLILKNKLIYLTLKY